VAAAEGHWTGKTDEAGPDGNDMLVNYVVLDNGQTWGIFTGPAGTIWGGLYGSTSSSGGKFSGSGFKLESNGAGLAKTSGSFSGSYTAKALMSGTAAGINFNASYDPKYDGGAASVTGNWTGSASTGTALNVAMNINISSAGVITNLSQNGCTVSGSVKPRAGGKNVYDMTLTFSGSACKLGNGLTVNGVAFSYNYPTTNRHLLMMGQTSSQGNWLMYDGMPY